MQYVTKTLFGTKWVQTSCKICNKKHFQKDKGRYKEYCSDNCRNYFKYLSSLNTTLTKIIFSDLASIKSIKSDLFSIINSLPRSINNV